MFKFLTFLVCLLKITLSQLSEYTIGQTIEETITANKYYMVSLDQEKASQNQTLVIYVKPSDHYEEFSDPDLYVSIKNFYPNTYFNSEWRSTNLGRDIITIPPSELGNATTIYIGIECLKKCKYDFKVEYQEQVELLELAQNGIHVAEFMTQLPAPEIFEQKLHKAIAYAKARLEGVLESGVHSTLPKEG